MQSTKRGSAPSRIDLVSLWFLPAGSSEISLKSWTLPAIVSLSERSAEIAQGVEGRSKSGAKVNHQHDMIALTSADIASMPWLPKKNDLVCIEIEGLPVEFLIRSVRPHDHGSRSIWIHRKG
jgi:hypothetical protein